MWLSKHFSIEYRLIVACTVTLRFHVISHGWPPKQAIPYVTIILTVRNLRTRKGEKTATPRSLTIPHQFSKNRTVALWRLRRKLQSSSQMLGRLLFHLFFSFLPSPLAQYSANVNICARNCSVISQHWIGQGRRGIFRKRENSLFEH